MEEPDKIPEKSKEQIEFNTLRQLCTSPQILKNATVRDRLTAFLILRRLESKGTKSWGQTIKYIESLLGAD